MEQMKSEDTIDEARYWILQANFLSFFHPEKTPSQLYLLATQIHPRCLQRQTLKARVKQDLYLLLMENLMTRNQVLSYLVSKVNGENYPASRNPRIKREWRKRKLQAKTGSICLGDL